MTVKHVRGTYADADGTGLTAYFTTTYDNLVKLFGPPNRGPNAPGVKVTCEWILKFGDEVVTIYDWKESQTPMGVYQWCVGSKGLRLEQIRALARTYIVIETHDEYGGTTGAPLSGA